MGAVVVALESIHGAWTASCDGNNEIFDGSLQHDIR